MLKLFLIFNIIIIFLSLFLRTDFLVNFFCAVALSIQWLYSLKIGNFSGIDVMGILFPLSFVIKIFFSKNDLHIKRNIFFLDYTITLFYFLVLSLFLSGVLPIFIKTYTYKKTFLDIITPWAKYSTGFIVFVFFVLYTENKEKFIRICKSLSLTLLLPSGYFLWQIFTGDLIHKIDRSMPSVGFHNPHIITYAIVLILPLLYFLFFTEEKAKNKVIYIFSMSLLLAIAYLSYARTGWLGVFADFVLFVYFLDNRKIKFLFIFLFLFILLVLCFYFRNILDPIFNRFQDIWFFINNFHRAWTDNSPEILHLFNARWGIWRANLKIFFHRNPLEILFGSGIGTCVLIGEQAGIYVGASHNAYLALLIDFGVVNFILFLILIYSMFRKAIKMLKTKDKFLIYVGRSWLIILSAYSILGMGTHIFYHVAISVWIFWAICGACMGVFVNIYKAREG